MTEEVNDDTKKNDEVVDEPTVEDKAKEKGWVPLEEYTGDKDEWVEAKEFLAREPLYKALHKVNRNNKKLKETLAEVRKMFNNVHERATSEAMQRLKTQFEQAAAEGNVKEAIEARDKMRELEATPDSEPVDGKQIYTDWVTENKWFTEDKVLRNYANGVGQELINERASERGGINKLTAEDIKDIYDTVTEDVKAQFPDKFMNPNRKKPSTVNDPGRRNPGTSSGKDKVYTIDDLPDEDAVRTAKRVMRTAKFSEEQYLKFYREGGGKFKGEA